VHSDFSKSQKSYMFVMRNGRVSFIGGLSLEGGPIMLFHFFNFSLCVMMLFEHKKDLQGSKSTPKGNYIYILSTC